MHLTRCSFLALLALASLSACATTSRMAIRSMEPGRVQLGAARHLMIVDSQGRRSAREFVNMEVVRQSRSRGYFTVEDRSEDGVSVRVSGRSVVVEGSESLLSSDQVGLRVDVLEWDSQRDSTEVQRVGPDGYAYTETIPIQRGDVLLAVTLFDTDGRALLAETEYEGTFATQDMYTSRDVVIERAASGAIEGLLNDITPSEVVTYVTLDEDDPGQEAILKTAQMGNVAQAAADLRGYLERNPYNAAAAYNLAVFLEAMGNFAEALQTYDLALSLGNKSFYANARAECARRIAAATVLES